MPTRWDTFPIEFRGGLISNLSPLQQGINAVGSATLLQNFEPSLEGGYKKVLGFSKYIAGSVPGSDEMLGVKVVNGTKVIAARKNASNVTRYYINVGAAWSTLATASALGGTIRGADFNFDGTHRIFFVDGVNGPGIFEDDTDTMTFPSGYPADVVGAKYVAQFKNAIFVAKGTKLIFSAPFSYTDFSAASGGGVINIAHTITGIIAFREQLIVFSRNKIVRLVGDTIENFTLQPIAEDIGCIDGDTIQEVGGDVMFLAPDGLRTLSATERIGDFGLDVASKSIKKDIDRFVQLSSTFCSVVLREKAQYRVFGYITSEQKDTAKGIIGTKFVDQGGTGFSWAETKGIKARVSDSRYTDLGEIIVFANEDGYVYRLEQGSSFDGSNIEAIYQSPFMPINDPQIRKTFHRLTLFVDPDGLFEFELSIRLDFEPPSVIQPDSIMVTTSGTSVSLYGGSGTVYGVSLYGQVLEKEYRNLIIGSGRTFAIRIEDNSTNASFTLDTAVLEYATNERR